MGKISKRITLALFVGFITGALWLVLIRLVTYRQDIVHFHANFALYIDGQRESFNNFTYYEEVAACGTDEKNNPKTRVHMHDNVNSVVHVHDDASTWGHFFANLGLNLSNTVVQTDAGVFRDGQDGKRLQFMLNGKEVGGIANQTIRSEDVLLINYGNEDQAEIRARYDDIPHDAGEYNSRHDPAACKGSEDLTFSQRLRKAIGVGN
jgi:hypothetical protein